MNQGLVKNFVAGGTIGQRRIVKPHSTAGEMVVAAAVSDALFGICVQPGGATVGERVDIQLDGIAEVVAGGNISAGAPVTADSNGAAVAAAPSTGVNNRIIGHAFEAAVSGDIVRVILARGTVQG